MHELRGLYAITRESGGKTDRLLSDVQSALLGGVRMLQYRDKSASQNQRKQEARELRALCDDYDTRLIINDDLELAADTGADGVHLGKNDESITAARTLLGADAIIGVSCYNQITLAKKKEQQGADYIAFGSFFPSPTKPAAVAAKITLLQAWENHPIPTCAIGGITLGHAPALIAAGADMLAVISDLWDAENIEGHARAYSRLWRR